MRNERCADLLLALCLHLGNASSIFEVTVLLQGLSSFLQLPAAVLQLLYVVLLLYDCAFMLMLVMFQVIQVFLKPLDLHMNRQVVMAETVHAGVIGFIY